MNQTLQRKVHHLREIGFTTPEICAHLNLGLDAVISLLLHEPVSRAPVSKKRKGVVGRPKVTLHESDFVRLVNMLTSHQEAAPLWTLPCVIQELRLTIGPRLSTDTLRRYLHSNGLTFSQQMKECSLLEEVEELVRVKRSLLYVLTHSHARDFGFDSVNATALIGISSSNRLAFSIYQQSRISCPALSNFLTRLLLLHSQRHVTVFFPKKRYGYLVQRSIVPSSQRLHLVPY
ncbi:hypothetical protein NDI52_07405 [Leptolyngbya sp. PL-A3]|uniref:hypothetical protein n=1 Tax=Leptolyngbya sp. PL-A3 TaxID=2933911 RepID=UPI003299F6F1